MKTMQLTRRYQSLMERKASRCVGAFNCDLMVKQLEETKPDVV
jgi:hypothetical protein